VKPDLREVSGNAGFYTGSARTRLLQPYEPGNPKAAAIAVDVAG